MDTTTVSPRNPLDRYGKGMEISPMLRIETDLCYESAYDVVGAVKDCLVGQPGEVVLDLAAVDMIDSSGLRMLLQAHKACEDAGAALRIGCVSECVARILGMSGLAPAFGVPEVAWESLPRPADDVASVEQPRWRVYEYTASSDPYVIAVLRDKAVLAAREAGATGDDLCDAQIAVGEALTNAYKHGSPRKGTDKIVLRCLSCDGAVAFEVEDEGDPFDPDATPEPDPRRLRDHGMGIYLMRMAMDQVEFTSGCPGNRVRMVKWLRS